MASSSDLLIKLKTLADCDKILWKAFCAAEEKAKLPEAPSLNFRRMHRYSWPLCKDGLLKWYLYQPLVMAVLYIGVFVTAYIMTSIAVDKNSYAPLFKYLLCFLVVAVMGLWLYESESKSHDLHTIRVLGSSNYSANSFGIRSSSLLIFYFLQEFKNKNIKKEDIAAIIKIAKSSHEQEDVSIGFVEYLKKFIIGGVFSMPFFAIQHFQDGRFWFDKTLGIKSTVVITYVAAVFVLFLYMIYQLIFSSAYQKKRKKRYLLALNIIHESWV